MRRGKAEYDMMRQRAEDAERSRDAWRTQAQEHMDGLLAEMVRAAHFEQELKRIAAADPMGPPGQEIAERALDVDVRERVRRAA